MLIIGYANADICSDAVHGPRERERSTSLFDIFVYPYVDTQSISYHYIVYYIICIIYHILYIVYFEGGGGPPGRLFTGGGGGRSSGKAWSGRAVLGEP